MKKLVLILFVGIATMLLAPKVEAQTALKSRYSVALDTVTNTGTKNMTSLRIAGPAQTVTVSTKNIVITGTLAGVARLWGSLNGVDYSRIRSSQLQGAQVDSLVIDAAHSVYHWVVEKSPYQYYQVQSTGAGSETFTVQGKYVAH